MHRFKLKIPPPLVAFVMSILMWFIARAAPTMEFVLPARRSIAACVALVGVLIAIVGVAAFRAARTTVNPLRPEKASTLVTSGIYRFTRNPMYLGMLLVLTGWGLFLSNALAFLVLPGFVLYMNRFQIGPEERALESLFAEDFVAYRSKVRRWL